MSTLNKQHLIDQPLCYLCFIEDKVKPATAIVCVDAEQRSVCARHASALDDEVSHGSAN
jgi:hypothetical protein